MGGASAVGIMGASIAPSAAPNMPAITAIVRVVVVVPQLRYRRGRGHAHRAAMAGSPASATTRPHRSIIRPLVCPTTHRTCIGVRVATTTTAIDSAVPVAIQMTATNRPTHATTTAMSADTLTAISISIAIAPVALLATANRGRRRRRTLPRRTRAPPRAERRATQLMLLLLLL